MKINPIFGHPRLSERAKHRLEADQYAELRTAAKDLHVLISVLGGVLVTSAQAGRTDRWP
jgi:hypothetical protein